MRPKKFLAIVLLSVLIGLIATLLTGQYKTSQTATPRYSHCADCITQSTTEKRGLPFTFRKSIKVSGGIAGNINLASGPTTIYPGLFIVDVVIWAIVWQSIIYLVIVKKGKRSLY